MGQPQLRPWLRLWLRLQLGLRLWSYKNILINRSQAVSGSFSVELWHANAARIVRSLHASNNNANIQWDTETDSGTVRQTPVNRACLNGWLIRRVNVYLALLIEFLPRWSINSSSSNSSSNCSSYSSSGNRSSNSCNQVWRLYCSVTRSWQGGASSKRSQLAFNTHIWKSFAQKQGVCCVCQCRSRHALRG